MESLKPSFGLVLRCPSIEYTSLSKNSVSFLRAKIMSSNFSAPHSTYNDILYLEKHFINI